MRLRGDILTPEERDDLSAPLRIYSAHKSKNATKERYYEGKISLRSVNLGIALPEGLSGLEIGCAWGAKTVDVLASRSIFDGFVAENGGDLPELDRIVEGNRLIAEYAKACRDELKFGTTFATLSRDEKAGCKIRWHSPMTAAANWDGSEWQKYIRMLTAIDKTAARKFEAWLNGHDYMSEAGKKAAVDYAWALSTKYGEAAAAAACDMYDATAEATGMLLPPAEPAATATYGEVAKTIRGIMKQSGNTGYIATSVERLVKQAGADTTLKNAVRDGAEFAWIPHGDTCAFCITLASNGWRQASKKVLKGDHADHIHAHCDCEFAIRFNGQPKYAGYDPKKYREQYENAEGSTWQEKLNSMRREDYAERRDEINAQKRDAYARRNHFSGSSLLLAAQEGNDISIPPFMEGNFDDCHPLSISDEDRGVFRRIHDRIAENGCEYGEIITSSGIIPCESDSDWHVKMRTDSIDEYGLKLYHGHTNDTLPSEKDLFRLVVDGKVDVIGVVTRNGDVFCVTVGEGFIPEENEFWAIAKKAGAHARRFVADNYDLSTLTEKDAEYLVIREKNIEIIRQLGWRVEGGKL